MAGVIAPKANYASVTFHEEGTRGEVKRYLNIQNLDDNLLREHLQEQTGTVWDQINPVHPRLNLCLGQMPGDKVHTNYDQYGTSDASREMECSEGCADNSAALLRELVDVGGKCSPRSIDLEALWTKLDKRAFLRLNAVDQIINHYDGMCMHHNNWRVHRDAITGRFQVLPWGTDMSFSSSKPVSHKKLICLQMRACFENAECSSEYAAEFADITTTLAARRQELVDLNNLMKKQGAQGDADAINLIRSGIKAGDNPYDPIVGQAQHEDAAVGSAAGSAAGPSADTSATDFVAPVVAAAGIVVAVSVLVAAYLGSRTSQPRPEHGAEDGVDGLTWDGDDLADLSATGTVQ